MGMFAFKLTLLFCILSTICNQVEPARILENNSSELWKKLLLTEDQEVPPPQSSPLSRRITPKSIFIVPTRDLCPPGQSLDTAGKCVRLVSVDENANRNFLLTKLKIAFSMTSRPKPPTNNAGGESSATTTKRPTDTTDWRSTTTTNTTTSTTTVAPLNYDKQPVRDSSGPLQLSIPLHGENGSEYSTDADSVALTYQQLKKIATAASASPASGANKSPPIAAVTETPPATETPTETTTDSAAATEPPTTVGEPAGSTFASDLPVAELTSTEIPDPVTLLDTAASTDLSVIEIASNVPAILFGADSPTGHFEPFVGDETTTNRVYRIPGRDILKTSVRFPESSEKRTPPAAAGHVKHVTPFTTADRKGSPSVAPQPAYLNTNYKGATDTKETTNEGFAQDAGSADLPHHSSHGGGGGGGGAGDINLSGSSDSFAFSNSENTGSGSAASSIISFKNDPKDQKLPSGERVGLRTKCDPATGYNCIDVQNVAPPEKNLYSLNRNPFPPYIRFPGIVTNSLPSIRFPHGQKAPANVHDFVSLAEANAGFNQWAANRYTNSYWTPQLVRIWPDNVDGINAYNSRSQTVTFS